MTEENKYITENEMRNLGLIDEELEKTTDHRDDDEAIREDPTGDVTWEMLYDVTMDLRVILAREQKTVEEILEMNEGDIVELDRLAGELVEICIGDHVFAKGEVRVVDEQFAVLITEILPVKERFNKTMNKKKVESRTV